MTSFFLRKARLLFERINIQRGECFLYFTKMAESGYGELYAVLAASLFGNYEFGQAAVFEVLILSLYCRSRKRTLTMYL